MCRLLYAFIAIFLINLPLQAVDNQLNEDIPPLEKTFSDAKGYSILIPKGWRLDGPIKGNIDLLAVNKQTGQSISVIVSPHLQHSLTDYVNDGIVSIRNATNGFQIMDQGDLQLSGHEAKWVLYTGYMSQRRAEILQVFTSNEDKLYIITFGALEEDFQVTKPYFNDILNSFTFETKNEPTRTANLLKP
jgi:hypothetical protein